MPQFRRCWVPNCRYNQNRRSEQQFFKFPRDPERCMKWLKAIGDPTLASSPWEILIRLRYVCMEHFTPEMFTAAGRLTHNAEPIIFADVRPELPEGALRSFLEGLPQERRSALPALHVVDNISPEFPECSDPSTPGGEVHEENEEGDISYVLPTCSDDTAEANALTEEDMARPENIGTYYVAGYIGKCMVGVLKDQHCSICLTAIKSDEPSLGQMYTQSLEYDPHSPALIYANKQLWSAVQMARNLFVSNFVESEVCTQEAQRVMLVS